MRRQTLLAGMTILAVLLPLGGCAEKQEEPQKVEVVTLSDGVGEPAQPVPAERKPAEPNVTAEEPVAVSPDTAMEEVPAQFGEVLVAWNTGKRSQAIAQFLRVPWEDPAVFQGVPVLTMSEPQFASLSPAQRDQVNQQAQHVSKILSELARGLFSAADDLASSGNPAAAQRHLAAVQRFGQALAAPQRLTVIQALGHAVMEVTREKQASTPP